VGTFTLFGSLEEDTATIGSLGGGHIDNLMVV
jgi:hypothetical protein